MWQTAVGGTLAAILALTGIMLWRSRRPKYRERPDNAPLGKHISDDIERLLKAADPLAGQPSGRLSVTAAQLRERAVRRAWWRWRR